MKPDREECEGEEDVDQSFLDEVLNKLYDFGDAAKARKTKKSRQKRKRQPEEEDNLGSAEETCNDGGEVSHERLSSAPAAPSAATAGDAAPTPVKCNVEIVTFIDPLKKKRLTNTVEPEAKPREKKAKEVVDPEEFSIEKARLEVHRLGITGYQKTQQRDFEQDRAIMLGARPPKRQHINYKVYQQMMKERKTKAKEETKPEMKKKKKGRVEKPKNDKRKPSSGAEPGTQVGRFKNGMLVLNSKDIHKLNGKMKK